MIGIRTTEEPIEMSATGTEEVRETGAGARAPGAEMHTIDMGNVTHATDSLRIGKRKRGTIISAPEMTGATREALDGNGIGTDTVTKSGRAAAHRPTTSGRILKTSTNLGGKAGVTVQPLLEAGADSGSKQVRALMLNASSQTGRATASGMHMMTKTREGTTTRAKASVAETSLCQLLSLVPRGGRAVGPLVCVWRSRP
jgi:hypothetical protein